jgi:hypothetical protein
MEDRPLYFHAERERVDAAVAARLQLDEDGWPPAPLERRGIDVQAN